jgi:hypothetical protein
VKVHSAGIQDRDGGKTVLKASRARYPFVTRAFADGGYAGRLVRWAKDKAHIGVEVVKRSPAKGPSPGSSRTAASSVTKPDLEDSTQYVE